MNINDTLDALRPLVSQHETSLGNRVGFLMADAIRALGGLSKASDALAMLLAEGLVGSEPVMIDCDVHTLYFVTGMTPPTIH